MESEEKFWIKNNTNSKLVLMAEDPVFEVYLEDAVDRFEVLPEECLNADGSRKSRTQLKEFGLDVLCNLLKHGQF